MRLFDPLIALLSEIPDPRRAEGKLYQLPYVLLFAILAVVTGGNSDRAIKTFIAVNLDRLNGAFGLCWKRAPAHTAIRTILQSLDPKAVEQTFRLTRTIVLIRGFHSVPATAWVAPKTSMVLVSYRLRAMLLEVSVLVGG